MYVLEGFACLRMIHTAKVKAPLAILLLESLVQVQVEEAHARRKRCVGEGFFAVRVCVVEEPLDCEVDELCLLRGERARDLTSRCEAHSGEFVRASVSVRTGRRGDGSSNPGGNCTVRSPDNATVGPYKRQD